MTMNNEDIRICLLYPPSDLPPFLNSGSIPLGVYVVGTILKRNGMKVSLMDQFHFLHYLEDEVELTPQTFIEDHSFRSMAENIDVLGISTDSFNYCVAKLMIQAARSINSEILIILGGIHPSLLDEYVLRTSGADVIFRGEAEERIVDLVKCLAERKPLDAMPGISYRGTDGALMRNDDAPLCSSESLAQLSKVDYQLVSNLENLGTLPLETSRGCLNRCRFCSVLFKGKRRLFPIDEVKARIVDASRLKNFLLFTDDCFTFERKRAGAILEFFSQFEDKFLHFEARASDLAGDDCALLDGIAKEKIKDLQIGVECGYDEGLRRIKKGISLTQVKNACRLIQRKGVEKSAILTFIIGFPWEATGECVKTIDFAARMREQYGVGVGINYWVPSPSELWSESRDSLGIDESMFDRCHWPTSDDIFHRTHPLISAKNKYKLSFLIERAIGSIPS